MIEQGDEVVHEEFDRILSVPGPAPTVAPHVVRDQVEVVSEDRRLRLPHAPVEGEAVDEDDRDAGARPLDLVCDFNARRIEFHEMDSLLSAPARRVSW